MTEKQIQAVQDSFALVRPIADRAAESFYARLFEIDPSARELFRGDMKQQGRKLMMMMATVVAGLPHLDQLRPAIRSLGKNHVQYGVEHDHYESVGEALLWTLAQCLGENYTPDVDDGWKAAYNVLSKTMKEAAYGVNGAAASNGH